MRAIYNRGAVVIADGEVTPDSLRKLRRALWHHKLSPHNGYYNLTLTNQQADELSDAGRDELVYMNEPGNGLAIIQGFRITDIGWEVSLIDA